MSEYVAFSVCLPAAIETPRFISFGLAWDGRVKVLDGADVILDESVPAEIGFLAQPGKSYDVVHVPESKRSDAMTKEMEAECYGHGRHIRSRRIHTHARGTNR